ncbi:cross-pathway control protein 1 [Achaetomium macrosporum]|uniref:Cross-pathway control protein 1 n=1 Tax=Achaetomium macrosporum TaxID=79813 RepID=A0AAN7C926_9PEZI|nr:cross-pathway control protein 1 [Achaetomium macrosporum]
MSLRHALRTVSCSPCDLCKIKVARIPSTIHFQGLPTQPTPSAHPAKVELNLSTLLHSSRSSSSHNTAAIPGQDFPVFTTDSNQSTWLPSNSPSLPAPSAQPLNFQRLNLPQQDFVLFDQPIRPRRQPNRSVSQPSANGGVDQNQQHRNQPLFPQQASTSPSTSLQNQRVASIIQATGHQATSLAFSNRFSSPAQNPLSRQFYASSAPSSSVALNVQKQNRPQRPPVPLFPQSTGNIPRGEMNIQGKPSSFARCVPHARPRGSRSASSDLDLEEFTAFEGGASTSAYSSPALPSVFDLSGSASSSTSNMGTVSPQDLLIHEPFMSAPNSTALTALTSPSIYNESPDFGDGYDVSPSFGSGDFDNGSTDAWFPLFPQTKSQPEVSQKPASAEHSPASKSDDLEVTESTSGHRRKSSGTSPPSSRPSSFVGVSSRRRDKPLPPIIVEDPTDVVAMKRARNTLAARKSRERKAQRLEELEEKILKLTAERDHWRNVALAHGAKE